MLRHLAGKVLRLARPLGDVPPDERRRRPSGRRRGVRGTTAEGSVHLVLLGLGVNGHLAFNDPPARFDDPQDTRVVELDDVSRQQQVDEGHFATIEEVPHRAITVTIPRRLRAQHVVASVPGSEKRDAVQATLTAPIGPTHPGTALRTHPDVALFLDDESAP